VDQQGNQDEQEEHRVTSSVASRRLSGGVVEPIVAGFTALYRSEQPVMVRVARLIVGSNAEAEELVHDAFVELHRRWDEVANPGGYLRTAVINRCRSHMRRRRLEWRNRLGVPPSVLAPEFDDMWQALESITPRQRVALVLRFYDDLTVDQIAEAMQTRPGTVKSLIHRGLRQLEKVVEP
jgi:RNA polymerase sigma factor (sigma-70 family)